MLIFENFISQYQNFRSRDSSSTRKLTRHSDMDDALNVWMPRHSRRRRTAVVGQRPLGSATTGEAAVEESDYKALPSRTRLFRPVTRWLSSRAQQWTVRETDSLGHVYSLMEVSISGVRAVLQTWLVTDAVLIKQRIQSACSFIDATPARPTDWLHSHCGWWLTSPPRPRHPLGINYHRVDVLGLPTPNSRAGHKAGGFAYWPSLTDRWSLFHVFIEQL